MQKPCFRSQQAELTEAAEVKDLNLIWLDEPKKVIPTPAGTVRVQQEPVVIQCGGIYTTEIPMSEIDLAFNSLEVLPSEAIHSKLLLEVPDALEEPLKIFSQNFSMRMSMLWLSPRSSRSISKTILRIPWKQGLTAGTIRSFKC